MKGGMISINRNNFSPWITCMKELTIDNKIINAFKVLKQHRYNNVHKQQFVMCFSMAYPN